MFVANDDLSLSATRGDIVHFNVSADDHGYPYMFKPGDILRMSIYAKKDASRCVMQKDFPVTEASETVFVFLDEKDTKIGEIISKPVVYWYEIVLNPDTMPQTIIGYDDDGPKTFTLFPESEEIGEEAVLPEEIPVVDDQLSMTSHRPIENQAVAIAIAQLMAAVEELKQHQIESGDPVDAEGSVFNALGQIEKLSVLTIDAYGVAVKHGFKGTVEEWLASLKGEKGDPGKDGYTPQKGVDYFDGKDGKDGYTPVKGQDYFDGQPGRDGYTPVKGKDYFDGKPGRDGVDGKDYVLTDPDKAEIAEMAAELVDIPDSEVEVSWNDLKDRPFYDETVVLYENPALYVEEDSASENITTNFLEEGETYIVEVDGKPYSLVCEISDDIEFTGNVYYCLEADEFEVYTALPDLYVEFYSKAYNNKTISLKIIDPGIKKLDSKYLDMDAIREEVCGQGSGGNANFQTDETLKLENGILSVNTTDNVEQDNTLPITSAGVFATVGNIEALLKTI